MSKIIREVPRYNCEEGRHEWGHPTSVLVEKKFLWWTYVVECRKTVCSRCEVVDYFVWDW